MSFNSKDFKGFTFRSGPVSKTKKSFSTFWDTNSDDVNVDDDDDRLLSMAMVTTATTTTTTTTTTAVYHIV